MSSRSALLLSSRFELAQIIYEPRTGGPEGRSLIDALMHSSPGLTAPLMAVPLHMAAAVGPSDCRIQAIMSSTTLASMFWFQVSAHCTGKGEFG